MATYGAVPPHRSKSARTRAMVCGLALACAVAIVHQPLGAAIALTAVTPAGATSAATVQITGTGFAPIAANNEVTLTSSSGVSRVVSGRSIVVINAATDLRRLAITVPAGLPVGPAAIQVRNTTTGEVATGRSLDIIELTIPQPVSALRGATGIPVRIVGTPNTVFVAGRTSVVFGAGVTVTATQIVSATELVATVSASATAALGQRTVLVASPTQSGQVPLGFQVVDAPPPNRDPIAAANGPYTGTEDQPIQFNSNGSSDPDNDPLQFSWEFGDGAKSTDANPQHTYATPGPFNATLTVSDNRGGTNSATAAVTVAPAVLLQSLSVAPQSLRFSELNATAQLVVTGHYSDGSQRDLTPASTGTTYNSSAAAVATASADGLVTAVGNGTTDITVANGGFSEIVTVVVEEGVLLQALELSPPIITLRALAATAPTTLRGSFSDGSLRDLTNDSGTTYTIDDTAVATSSAVGVLTAIAPGATVLTARYGGLSATAQVRVVLTEASGFIRGEVYDDTRGLPLAQTTATLLSGGGSALATPVPSPADDRGRFMLPAVQGAALVRVERSGFTTVERQVNVASNAVITLLDARLTPLDGRINSLQSIFGGEAASADGTATLSVPSGSLEADVALRVTPLSNQGLQGVLPLGWSPIAAVDLQPAGRRLTQGATLRLPHLDTLPAGVAVALARYDASQHQWIVQPAGQVSNDRRTVSAAIDVTGQFAFLVADESPAIPPPAVPGQALAGVAPVAIPDASTADGEVLPRSAPPGDGAKAVGTVMLQPPAPLPSGMVLRARVTEQFDLLDTSRVLPLHFVQDLVLFARPRLGAAGTLATRLPITPSLQFSIHQLSLGTVRLDVTIDEPASADSIVGESGGSITDPAGNVLAVPPGALSADVAIGLLPLGAGQLSSPVPSGFAFLGGVLVDLVGASFAQPALLSIPRPAGLDASAQVVVAQIISDPSGGRRLRLVGLGDVGPLRITIQTTLGPLSFPGVRSGGEYVFLHAAQPLGFITGLVTAFGGSFQPLALVTADTAPFAVVTDATGAFIVAGRAGVSTNVSALEPAGAVASGAAALAALNDVATLNLSVVQTAPAVTATIPAANAVNVALATPIVVDFSKAIDPATLTSSSAVLTAGPNVITSQLVMSANRRRLTLTPAAPLAGLTAHTLTLTSAIRDSAGVPLAAFTPLTFTTLDPSKATILAVGVIVAELPDEDELSLITGAPGAAEPNSAVVATNLRTQETVTVLALADGSFRLRVTVVIGDEIALTLRDPSGRETTITITQFTGTDGSTSIGSSGGTILGAAGRTGRILPRALSTAGVFHLTEAGDAPLPVLPASFASVDRFALTIEGAAFRALESIALTESQGRFAAATAFSSPFSTAAELTVPADFLVTASLRFTAAVSDRDGTRRSASGATVVVAGGPDTAAVESGFGDEFPTVFLTAPKQATPTQVVAVSAIAPAARIAIDLPTTAPVSSGEGFVLARLTEIGGEQKLAVVDRLDRMEVNGDARLRTVGRALPGASRPGEYVVVSGPFAFVTGRASGPAAVVTVDGLPFVFETGAANGAFVVPVVAGSAFTLRFVDAATGGALGSTTGQAPAAGGSADVGSPLAPATGVLTVTAQPDAQSVVDIGTPLVFTFSEALDRSRVTSSAFVVSDAAGARAFGRVLVSDDGRTVTFVPLRRWKFATRYRYGVATSVMAASGAALPHPFSGEFSTFAPRVLGTAAVAGARDIAVAGSLGVVATETGATVLGLTQPDAPVVLSSAPLSDGALGVAISALPLTDRNGQSLAPPIMAIASGGTTTPGLLRTYSLDTPTSPVLLGTTQLTTAAGGTPVSGVPPAVGVPSALVLDAGDAIVAVQDLGALRVSLGTAIPDNPSDPGASIEARYPAATVESVAGAALLGSNVFLAGSAGLTALDGSLQRLGGTSTAGDARAVATAAAFAMDADGDGQLTTAEQFDLAVVANGADGTVQMFRVSDPTAPELVSVVRLPATADAVVINVEDRLAYVGNAGRGLAIVDLNGTQGIQPIDLDRDGLDDRILGFVDTPGAASRIALALSRGIGYVVDGATGIVVMQLLPPRTTFETLRRDPVRSLSGDEQSILQSRMAFTSDDGLALTLHAAVPPQSEVFLVIDEVPVAGGPRLLSFPGGGTSAALSDGLTSLVIDLLADEASVGSTARLKLQSAAGAVLSVLDLDIAVADPGNGTLESLRLAPRRPTIPAEAQTTQLSVLGIYSNGLALNLSRASTGTTYAVASAAVASIDANGLAAALAGGVTEIRATNGAVVASDVLKVEHAPVLTGLRADQPFVTFTSAAAQAPTEILAVFSDGTTRPAAEVPGVGFASSNPAVVTVDAAGVMTAQGEGAAVVSALSGSIEAEIQVAAEFRIAPNVTAIDLAPFADGITTDDESILAHATIAGTGSLEGLTVSVSITGDSATPAVATTSYNGVAIAELRRFAAAGSFTVTATIVNPATGQPLVDSATLIVGNGSGDLEPNSSSAQASPLKTDVTVSGTLDGATDPIDTFQIAATEPGTYTATVTLAPGTNLTGVTVVVLDASGVEVARLTPTGLTSTLTAPQTAGPIQLRISATSPVTYALSTEFVQADITVVSVAPSSGGPGTPVRILGTGFSTRLDATRVLFGGIVGKVLAVSATSIDVVVPANAVDGAIEVISAARRASGPQFTTGNGAVPAPIVYQPSLPPLYRFNPISGEVINVRMVNVHFDPTMTREQAAALGKSLGGVIAGTNPTLNSYVFEFATSETVAGAERAIQGFVGNPSVLFALSEALVEPTAMTIDLRDVAGNFASGTPRSVAYQQAQVFAAIEAVRSTPPFDASPPPFRPVRMGVIDSGFDPAIPSDFRVAGNNFVLHFREGAGGALLPQSYLDEVVCFASGDCDGGHGTAVTSIIGAVNDGFNMSGALNGVFKPGEPVFPIRVYKVQRQNGFSLDLNGTLIEYALTEVGRLANSATPIDVVNMSFGGASPDLGPAYQTKRTWYRTLLQLMAGRTLAVIAAGNNGVEARFFLPAALHDELPHVMSIGATAVANGDGTGETGNVRAVYGGIPPYPATACSPLNPTKGSNCGSGVTLAAPGEDVLMMLSAADPGAPGFFSQANSRGTSMASPMTASIAGMIQAIRPTAAPMPPDQVRQLLVRTGTDISASWRPGAMRMLNALAAVRSVLQSPADQQHIYVADNNAPTSTSGRAGTVVAINIDPTTGQPTPDAGDDREIRLSFVAGAAFFGQSPVTLVTAPTGNKLYALVTAETPAIGEGVLVISTTSFQAEGFIALSGEPVDPALIPGAQIQPVGTSGLKAGMVVSPDGRLLYVASGRDITIINLVSETVVRSLRDLPAPFNTLDILQPPSLLGQRLVDLNTRVLLAPPTGAGAGRFIGGLSLSPDGRTLYAVVTSGGGSGQQPGAVQAIDVNLYTDGMPDVPGLQPDLTNYFKLIGPAMRMSNALQPAGGDEPSGVALNGQGEHLYLTNGGVSAFEGLTPGALDPAKFYLIMGGPIFAALQGGFGGFLGLATSISAFSAIAPSLYNELLSDLTALRNGGSTLLAAPSFTGVFNADPGAGTVGTQTGLFPSDVVFGWNPSPANGGLVVNQSRFSNVFGKRPFGMAISPDGRRAVMPMFQSGNFGFLDLETQTSFTNPGLAGLPADMFHGVVGVTRALKLDTHLWPSRGALRVGTTFVPSPDERLLYPTSATYAQNGVFIAAPHTGTLPIQDITVPMPDFEHDFVGAKFPLESLGFTLDGSTGIAPDGLPVQVGQPYTFTRGGGAITILNDAAMAQHAQTNRGRLVPGDNGIDRPFFTQFPITDTAVTHIYDYTEGTFRQPLYEPRGLAIQPFVSIESPRFGDRLSPTDALQIAWRDSRVTAYEVRVVDMFVVVNGQGTVVAVHFDPLTPAQLQRRSASFSFTNILHGFVPSSTRPYRIEVDVKREVNGVLTVLSTTAITVRFDP